MVKSGKLNSLISAGERKLRLHDFFFLVKPFVWEAAFSKTLKIPQKIAKISSRYCFKLLMTPSRLFLAIAEYS